MGLSTLEVKRLKLELVKVATARNELEFKIEERLDEIERLRSHITLQHKREVELTEKIAAEEATTGE